MHKVKHDKKTYYYAYKGGPRIMAEFGTKAFERELKMALRERDASGLDTLDDLLRAWMMSSAFKRLRPETQKFYRKAIDDILDEWSGAKLAMFDQKGARSALMDWRDEIADGGTPRIADRNLQTLRTAFNFAHDREYITHNPLMRYKALAKVSRRDVVWTDADVEAFLAHANGQMAVAFKLGLLTGQRKGDLLNLKWSQIIDGAIRITQSKTGAMVAIPVEGELADLLNSIERVGEYVLVNTHGQRWKNFSTSWWQTCKAAGIKGLRFHDLRGTWIHRAYRDGWSITQIAAVSGHSEKDAEQVIRSAYLPRSAGVDRAEKLLEESQKRSNFTQTVAQDIEKYEEKLDSRSVFSPYKINVLYDFKG